MLPPLLYAGIADPGGLERPGNPTQPGSI